MYASFCVKICFQPSQVHTPMNGSVRWHGHSMFTFSRNLQTVFKSDSYAFQFGLAYLTQTDSISIHCGLTHQQGHLADRMQMTKTSSLFSGSPLPGERPHSLVEMSEKSFLPPGICLKEGRRKYLWLSIPDEDEMLRWPQYFTITPLAFREHLIMWFLLFSLLLLWIIIPLYEA